MTCKAIIRGLVISIGLAGVISTAVAQVAADNAANSSGGLEEVVVTGSRVILNGNDSPTPVTVVTTEQMLDVHPTIVADALNDMPVFSGSMTQTSNPGNSSQNSAENQLNLRAVGPQRTLILYDGHRVPPASPRGVTDVDMIPQMLLQRVDVVTGGASAVYGSDAVSGVVNFITDTHFNGVKANANTGISQYGDGKIYDVGIAFGTGLFGNRGHFEGSYQYHYDEGIFNKLNRPWGALVWSEQGGGTVNNPYHLTANTRISNSSFTGHILSGALNDLEFAQNGVLTPFVHGSVTGTSNIESGGDGAYYSTASLKSLYVTHQGFGRFDYDLTDNLHAFAELAGTMAHNRNNHQLNEVNNLQIGYNNAFLAGIQPQYQTLVQSQLTANPLGSFAFGKMMLQEPTLQPDSRQSQFMIFTGLDGSFGNNYKWSVFFSHSTALQDTRNNANLNEGHLLAAMNSVLVNGQVVCNAAIVNPASYGNCVPLNLFGPTSESQAALQYITAVTEFWAHNKMDDFSASLTGAPVSSWAGPINMALSGEWRKQEYEEVSNALPSDHPDCKGIQFNCTATTPLWISNVLANRTPVSNGVWEIAYETDVPLVKDKPFFQGLDLNGAIRYTKYDSSGNVMSWKVGVDWHVTDAFTLRGTRSRDIRAPTLDDLYSPDLINPAGYTDIHTGTNGSPRGGQINFITQSNPNLKPEKADVTTAGIVWRPDFLGRFSLAVDGYRITIKDAISVIQGQNPVIQQICEDSGGTSPYCALIIRPLPFSDRSAANFPSATLSVPLNIAKLDTYGVDMEANYAATVLGHNLTLRGLMSWQPHIIYDNGPTGIVDMGGAATGQGGTQPSPSLKATLIEHYDLIGNFGLTLQERYRNPMKRSGIPTQIFSDPPVPAIWYTDMTLSYTMQPAIGRTELFLNIKNLFNQQPVPVAGVGGGSRVPGLFGGYAQGDDPVGRYFMVGVRLRH